MGGRVLIFFFLMVMTFLEVYSAAKSAYSKKVLKGDVEKKSNHLRLNKEDTTDDAETETDNNSQNDPDSNSNSGSDSNSNKQTLGQTSGPDSQESDETDQVSDATNKKEDLDASKNNIKESDEDDSSASDPEGDETPRLQLKDEKRSLMAGDTFAASEMLPIAKKLISKELRNTVLPMGACKTIAVLNLTQFESTHAIIRPISQPIVDNPGEGKGIVSSAKNSQELTDRLFEAFFLTQKRIVTLKDFDIAGLDALQALALSGEPANMRTASQSLTAPPKYRILNLEGQYVGVDSKPRQCHYRLITKKDNTGRRKPNNNKRRQVVDLASKLAKKRRLVVKASSKDENKIKTVKKISKHIRTKAKKLVKKRSQQKPAVVHTKNSKAKALRSNQNKINAGSYKDQKKNDTSYTSKPACRWQYKCDDMSNLDTCRLHTKCNSEVNKPIPDLAMGNNRNEEYTIALQRFRKMLRISDVDEEVEKILENRIINLRPLNMKGVERLETLAEYFNKIILSEVRRTTTPIPPAIVELLTEAYTDNIQQEIVAKSDEKAADDENKERKKRPLSDTPTTPLGAKHN